MLMLAMSAVLILAGCGKKKSSSDSSEENQAGLIDESTEDTPVPTEEPTSTPKEEKKSTSTPTPTEEPPAPKTESGINELSGEPIDTKYDNKRPVSVMYNNIKDGLPHCGIGEAEIVYEAYVEGGITRLLGIFKKYDTLENVGSIRSARSYYVTFSREYNAVLSHFGGPHKYVDEILKTIDHLDGQLTADVYYRVNDRVAPHNAFGNGEGWVKGFEKYNISTTYTKDYQGQHFKFADPEEPVMLENGIQALKVTPGYVYNKPYVVYNEETGLYDKFQFGEADVDGNTGEQLTYKNIIIQYATGRTLDGSPYLEYDLVDSGKTGWYITNGKAIKVTWEKKSDKDITRYYDESGEEITLNVGKTYVFLFPAGTEHLTTIE